MASSTYSRRRFLSAMAAGTAGTTFLSPEARAGPPAPQDPKRPNLVVILSDQQHGRACGFQDPFFDTPSMDAFAQGAVVFDRAFCTAPQCSPSRASLLTGQYPHRTGVIGNIGSSMGDVRELSQTTLGALLESAGYQTAYFGKWHLGTQPEAIQGWERTSFTGPDEQISRDAVDFLGSVDDHHRPFALFVSYINPHDIYYYDPGAKDVSGLNIPLSASWEDPRFSEKPSVQKEFMTDDQGTVIWDRDRRYWEEYRDFYRGKVRLYDDELGKVLAALERFGHREDTVTFVTSDHGDMDTEHRLVFKGPFMYENMIHVPLMVEVPAMWGGKGSQRSKEMTVNVDLAPTLLEMAGADPITGDGHSLAPFLSGEAECPTRSFVIGEYYSKQLWINPIRMIRTDRYKYNRYIVHGEELYDLQEDPDEIVNLATDPLHAKVKEELSAELDRWMKATDDPFGTYGISTREGKRIHPES